MHAQAMPARVTRRARIWPTWKSTRAEPLSKSASLLMLSGQRVGSGVGVSALSGHEHKGHVVATQEIRPQQGRQVNLWHLAPPRTPPQSASPPSFGDILVTGPQTGCTSAGRGRGGAARACPSPPPSGACRMGGRAGVPILTCSSRCLMGPRIRLGHLRGLRCPAECLALARARGEQFGIWGGVDLGTEAGTARSA